MAQLELVLTIRMRWWVRPFIWLAGCFAFAMSPWMDDDDLDRLTENSAAFVAQHGIVVGCEEQR